MYNVEKIKLTCGKIKNRKTCNITLNSIDCFFQKLCKFYFNFKDIDTYVTSDTRHNSYGRCH